MLKRAPGRCGQHLTLLSCAASTTSGKEGGGHGGTLLAFDALGLLSGEKAGDTTSPIITRTLCSHAGLCCWYGCWPGAIVRIGHPSKHTHLRLLAIRTGTRSVHESSHQPSWMPCPVLMLWPRSTLSRPATILHDSAIVRRTCSSARGMGWLVIRYRNEEKADNFHCNHAQSCQAAFFFFFFSFLARVFPPVPAILH